MHQVRGWLWFLLAFSAIAWCATTFAQCLIPTPTPPKLTTLYGEVNSLTAHDLITAIQRENRKKISTPILLWINSPGGSIIEGGMIIDAMEASRRPIVTVCVSMCASMAAIVFESGAKRLMFPRAMLMFHTASIQFGGELPHMTSKIDLLNRVVTQYETHIAARAKISLMQLRANESLEWWLLADDALTAHLADAVITSSNYPASE